MDAAQLDALCDFYANEGLPLSQRPTILVSPKIEWPPAVAMARISPAALAKLTPSQSVLETRIGQALQEQLPPWMMRSFLLKMALGDAYDAIRLPAPVEATEHSIVISPLIAKDSAVMSWYVAREAFYLATAQNAKLYDLFPFDTALGQYAAERFTDKPTPETDEQNSVIWMPYVFALGDVLPARGAKLSDIYTSNSDEPSELMGAIQAAAQPYCRAMGLPDESFIMPMMAKRASQ